MKPHKIQRCERQKCTISDRWKQYIIVLHTVKQINESNEFIEEIGNVPEIEIGPPIMENGIETAL